MIRTVARTLTPLGWTALAALALAALSLAVLHWS